MAIGRAASLNAHFRLLVCRFALRVDRKRVTSLHLCESVRMGHVVSFSIHRRHLTMKTWGAQIRHLGGGPADAEEGVEPMDCFTAFLLGMYDCFW